MDDGRVVWSASSSRESPDSPHEALDIYSFDPGTGSTTNLCNDDRTDIEPVIAGSWIAWTKDGELIHRVAQERAALEGIIGRPLEPLTEVFRLNAGTAWFWGLGGILREHDCERVTF